MTAIADITGTERGSLDERSGRDRVARQPVDGATRPSLEDHTSIAGHALQWAHRAHHFAVIKTGDNHTWLYPRSRKQFATDSQNSLDSGGRLLIRPWLLVDHQARRAEQPIS